MMQLQVYSSIFNNILIAQHAAERKKYDVLKESYIKLKQDKEQLDLLHKQNSETLNEKIKTVTKLSRENEELRIELDGIRKEVDVANHKLDTKDKGWEAKVHALEYQLTQAKQMDEKLRTKIKGLESQIQVYMDNEKEANNRINDLETRLSNTTDNLTKTTEDFERLKKARDSLEVYIFFYIINVNRKNVINIKQRVKI